MNKLRMLHDTDWNIISIIMRLDYYYYKAKVWNKSEIIRICI